MFYSGTSDNAINKIHERALKITVDNKIGSFIELLTRSQDMTNHHHQNIKILVTELLKQNYLTIHHL